MAAFILGAESFARKKDAVERVRAVLNGVRCNTPLAGPDLHVVLAALDLHAGAPEKTAKGIAGIVVRAVEYRPGIIQRCFFVMHPDGSETDFSYRVALGLSSSGPTVAEAARAAVWPSITGYKQARFGRADAIQCDLTQKWMKFADAHVDHAGEWPFSRIVREFVAAHGVPALRDEQVRVVFDRAEDASAFVAFHDARAVLQLVEKSANIAKGARG